MYFSQINNFRKQSEWVRMSFVIRLKHLPDEADSGDIRRFFKKVQIPEGGVRILGGEKGIVYITLTNETGLSIKYDSYHMIRMFQK